MDASWYAMALSPGAVGAGMLNRTLRPSTEAFPTIFVRSARITPRLCGSLGLSTPRCIGRRVSTLKYLGELLSVIAGHHHLAPGLLMKHSLPFQQALGQL